MRNGSWFLAPSRIPWNLNYQIATYCSIRSFVVSRIGRLYSSTQSSGPWPPWWLIMPLLQPILWNNQWQLVKILPVFYLEVMGQRCQVPIKQTATGRILSSVSRRGCVRRFQISSVYCTCWQTPLHPSASRPKVTRSNNFNNQGSQAYMISTNSFMDLLQNIFGFLLVDTPRVKHGKTSLVQGIIQDHEPCCPLPCFFDVLWEPSILNEW